MKILLFFISLISYINLFAAEELKDSVKLANDTLENISETGILKLPCDNFNTDKSKIIFDQKFTANGAMEKCFNFIQPDGEFGTWGNKVLETINSLPTNETENSFYANSFTDAEFVCPNFQNFSKQLKQKFWIWVIASISRQESNCRPNVSAQGPNSRAVGLLQLEDSARLRRDRGENCQTNDIQNPANNIACGVEILHQQLLGPKGKFFKHGNGELFFKGSYWQHLRHRSNDKKDTELMKKIKNPQSEKYSIKEFIMRFPYCR